MKTLRVVAGLHGGACLPLPPGRYRIGRGQTDETAGEGSLNLYDWTAPPLALVVDEAGIRCGVGPVDPSADDTMPEAEAWPELQPRRFGEVVLCIGDSERPWPTDAQLLRMLVTPGTAGGPSTRAGTHSWAIRGTVVGAGLLVAVGALYGAATGSPPKLPPPEPALGAQWLSRSLLSQGLHELQVLQNRRVVSLSGLVSNAQQGRAVRVAVADVQRSTGISVLESWEVADEIASTIEGALRAPGLKAHYLGAGRFEVLGTVADPQQLQHAAPQLQKDLGANVRSIEFSLEPIRSTPPFSVAMSADALQYSERPDGAKVFSVK